MHQGMASSNSVPIDINKQTRISSPLTDFQLCVKYILNGPRRNNWL